MSTLKLSILTVLALAAIATTLNLTAFRKNKQARQGIYASIIVFAVIASLLSLTAESAEVEYFKYAEVTLGIERQSGASTFCTRDSGGNKLTSYGNFKLNGIYVRQKNTEFSTNINLLTHHSCAFGLDKTTYDAVGIEAVYRVYF